MTTYKIVMVRHGESEWNQKNLFCGWFDADLSEKGRIFYLTLVTLYDLHMRNSYPEYFNTNKMFILINFQSLN